MKIGFGCDHAAIDLKNELIEYMTEKGYECVDYGTGYDENGEIIKCDYPNKGREVGEAVVRKDVDYGTFLTMVDKKEVSKVELNGDTIYFTDKAAEPNYYETTTFEDPDLVNRLEEAGSITGNTTLLTIFLICDSICFQAC